MRVKLNIMMFFILIFSSFTTLYAQVNLKPNITEYKTITDIKHREVSVPKNITKIISIGHGVTRLLVYIDDNGDVINKIVGIDQKDQKVNSPRLSYAFTHKSLSRIESVGIGKPFTIDIEKILKLRPDVIITSTDISKNQIDMLENKFNIPVVVVDDGYLLSNDANKIIKDEFYESMKILGDLFGKNDKYTKIFNYINNNLEDVALRVKNKNTTGYIYIGGLGFRGPQGIFSSRVNNITLKYLNLNNILNKEKFHFDKIILDKEKLLMLNPDYIFIDMSGIDVFAGEYNKNKEYFNRLKAFRNKDVFYLMPQEAYGYNVESILMNIYFMGVIFYPNEFGNIDLNKKYNEISHVFLNSQPVSTPGAFVNFSN
ncbi:ABC transporter substrate-binding protein [Salmonella enterica]|nr:ABC transporter substrate-binding protein [Salmonella enterica]EHM7583964.1 ABC transporter substrate-binding protein [Salmonella enterica]EHM7593179.1 ABC transporter substrate-binding protein [Salmonella enterica]EHM7606391.1 ABC transporter substrate-binding protein [Salmonella enterica]EHM7615479.1 ABC transporter substrate-binding protein [Salmonella enterica]